MKLIKWKDIHWDIVCRSWSSPWVLLGWPITTLYEKWGVERSDPLIGNRYGMKEPNVQIRLPWGPDPRTTYKNKELRASLTLRWFGWFWFWRDDLFSEDGTSG